VCLTFFGCRHVPLSRVFTLKGETYKVCCDCGAKFAYSLETMSIEGRLPLTPVLNPVSNCLRWNKRMSTERAMRPSGPRFKADGEMPKKARTQLDKRMRGE
jgi:hypothetical protein